MNHRIKGFFILFSSFSCLFGQGLLVSPNINGLETYSNRNLAMGLPRFSNPSLFNTFDHGGQALGLLEREKKDFRLETRFLSSEKSSDNRDRNTYSGNLILPSIYFNIPGMMGSNIYYRKIHDESSSPSVNNKLDLHNLGFDVALGLRSGYAQAGMSLHTIFFGEVKDDQGNERFVAAIPLLEVSLGTQPHKLIRIGAKLGVSNATLDTLNQDTTEAYERLASLNFPTLGFSLDFGDTVVLPLWINATLNFDRDYVWGTYQDLNDTDAFGNSEELDYNIIQQPGYFFNWQAMYKFENQGIQYYPAVMFGFWRKGFNRFIQRATDNYSPITNDGECTDGTICAGWTGEGLDHHWSYGGINLGAGFSIDLLQYVSAVTEWEFNSLRMKTENKPDSRLETFNKILIGGEGKLHNIPQWNIPKGIELYLRGSFSTGQENSNFLKYHPYSLQYFNRYTFAERELTDQGSNNKGKGSFVPDLGATIDWYTFNLGFGTGLWNGKLTGDVYASYFFQVNELLKINNQNEEFTGFEFGTSLRLAL